MSPAYPLRLDGKLDSTTTRWMWIFKWLLVIPHAVVLIFLYLGSALTSIVAFFAILLTGRYPRGLFEYNLGVLRWSWRVDFYSRGAFATDEYPPFTLEDVSYYPARLDVPYPEDLNRWLVLVKWPLALPHVIITALLVDVTVNSSTGGSGSSHWSSYVTLGVIPILALVAAVILALSGTYHRRLFDVLMGLNRWVYRVWAYMMLMTDEYPPFRLDKGGDDPATARDSPAATDPDR